LAKQVGEHGGQSAEADGMSAFERPLSKMLRQRGFAHSGGTSKQDIMSVAHKGKLMQLFVQWFVDFTRMIPIELVQRGRRSECGHLDAAGKVARFALLLFELT